jgi:tetratricopeptide (TPR) repeat protein
MSSKTPVVKQISWLQVIPQLVVMIALIIIVHAALRPAELSLSFMLGAAIYLVYSIGSRRIITSAHRNGMRLVKQGKFQEAIPHFERSYQLFARHKWIDTFRSLILMSPSAILYREMALLNTAFCHSQLGNAEMASEHYHKTLKEFPDSGMAKNCLRMIETFQGKSTPNTAPDQ